MGPGLGPECNSGRLFATFGNVGAYKVPLGAPPGSKEDNIRTVVMGDLPCLGSIGCMKSAAYGTGKEKDGTPVNIAAFVFALKDGHIGELWYVAPTADKAGISEATKVLESYRSP